jgi:LmbE family N-acetylglucosaminyl deacetylase
MQELTIERDQSAQPHAGKTFVAVHAHLADLPRFAGGLCAKLMAEGYTGYLVRTTNDETSGGQSSAQNILSNETEHANMAKALGFKDVFEFYYLSHRMNEISPVELRGRLVLLFRMLRADMALSFSPSAEGEPDSDHWITGRAVEEACWIAGLANDFHEHLEAGIQPHAVRELYHFHARPGQPFNHVVDISSYVGKKIDAIVECRSQGSGNAGSLLRARLAAQGKRLPLLGDDDRTADRAYARQFLLEEFRGYANGHDFEYAERFQYVGPPADENRAVQDYVAKNARLFEGPAAP